MSLYDDKLQQLENQANKESRLVSSLSNAANSNPEEFAEQIRLSNESKIALDAVNDYRQEAKQIRTLNSANIGTIWKDSPATADWLTNPNNANVAFDQVQSIGALENASRKAGFFATGLGSDLIGGGVEGLGHIVNATTRRANEAAIKYFEKPFIPEDKGDALVDAGQTIREAMKAVEPTGERTTADQVAAGLGQVVGQIGLMALPGGVPASVALMFGQGAKQQKDKIDFDKMSLAAPQSDKDWEVLTGGAITGATEFLATKLMLKTPQALALKNKMLDFTTKVALGATEEGIQEFTENVLSDVVHITATNPEAKIKWNEAAESGEVGAWVGGIVQTAINGALHIRARGQQEAFKNLNNVAAEQKLKERSPEAFQGFADALAGHMSEVSGGSATDVYINGMAFHQAILDGEVDPNEVEAAIPGIRDQLAQAIDTGGDIVIPMNDWIGKVAGTEMGNVLYQHARSTPDSLSIDELKEAKTVSADMQKQVDAIIEETSAKQLLDQELTQVEGHLFDDIKATGLYSNAVSRTYAQFVKDFYATQADRQGTSPLALYQEKPYRVVKGEASAEDLAQGIRGSFNPEKLTTMLTSNADYSTFLHETSHFFLTMYSDLTSSAAASNETKADMQTLLNWFGVKDHDTWRQMPLDKQRAAHEQFAYNYEQYLLEGKAPSLGAQKLFDRFSAWLKRIYGALKGNLNTLYKQEYGKDLPILNNEVRAVMDRMIATDEQIAMAENVRGHVPLFHNMEQAGVDPITWANYQELAKASSVEARHALAKESLKDMKWLEKARSKFLKEMQKDVRETRQQVKDAVTLEVAAMPEFAATDALKNAANEAERLAILDRFGFKSAYDLKAKTGNRKQIILERTNQRMLEENSDLFDEESQQQAIERALHNEARARFVATELKILSRSGQPVRVLTEAAKIAARDMLKNKTIGSLREKQFIAAGVKSGKATLAALQKDDIAAAINSNRAKLLNHHLASEALAIKAEVAKSMKLFKNTFKKDEVLSKSRDMNYIGVIRSMLSLHGLGKSDTDPAVHIEKIKAYDPEFFEEISNLLDISAQNAKPITALTVEEFKDLSDQINALWHLSRREKQMLINGKLIDRRQAVDELNGVVIPMIGGKIKPGYRKAITKWENTKTSIMSGVSWLRRVESWADAMDLGKIDGPFRKYIWNPVSESISKYRQEKVRYIKKYTDIIDAHKDQFTYDEIDAPEIEYTFKDKAELLHAILHTGNDSNKRKLLLGRGWGEDINGGVDDSRWQKMIARLSEEGVLTQKDFDFAQKVWDLLDGMKPAAQKAHQSMYGFYFSEVTANPVKTPFGTYAGGYVPAIADSAMTVDQAVNREKEINDANNGAMFPSTGRGFTKGRVDYNKPLLLDLNYLSSHIDKVLRFTHIEPSIKDVAKIVKNKDFGEAIDALNPTLRYDMLIPWLQRSATQLTSTPTKAKAIDKFCSALRTNTGLQMMVGNVVNTLQQVTGLSVALTKVTPKYLKMGALSYIRSPKDVAAEINGMSAYMQTRSDKSLNDAFSHIEKTLINPSKFEKVKDFAKQHGYFMQNAMQNVVDRIIWTGAYNEAIDFGLEHREAVRSADAAVRQTQGSFAPEDSSRVETNTPFVRMFTMFYSYFNMQANLLGSEFNKTVRQYGVKKGAGKLLYAFTMALAIPAVLSSLITQAAGGFDTGDDDDYDATDALSMIFGSIIKNTVAMVPGVGLAGNALLNRFNDKPYDDKISASPAIAMVDKTISAPFSLGNAIFDDGSWKKATNDVLTALGIISGIPLGQIAKPVGYAIGVGEGTISPETPIDAVRGAISGRDIHIR